MDVSNMTLDELESIYNSIASSYTTVEESFDIDRESIQKQLLQMDQIEKTVISEALFSENEEYDEINIEYLKYLYLPFVKAKLHYNANENRVLHIEAAKKLFIAFLNLCQHYQLLPKALEPTLENIMKGTHKPEREEKIRLYKASKAAKDQVETAEHKMKQTGKDAREYNKELLGLKCFQAVTDLEMIPQELEMLKFKQKLDTDAEFKKQYDEEFNKPKPKPYFVKLDDGSGKNGEATQINSKDIRTVGGTPVTGTVIGSKMDIMDKLWQPDHAQPKMTMEEFADLEYRLMIEKQEREKEHQKKEEEKMDRLNEDEKEDLQTLKDRAWDDWKDAHEKGAGNKKR